MKIRPGDVALITGASRGIGRHIALALARRGMDLVLAARSQEGLDAVAAEVRAATGVTVWTLTVDLGDRAQAAALVARAEEAAGRVDVLVNNAGLEAALRPDEVTFDELGAITDVNLLAPMLLTRRVLPGMLARGRGHVVNVSSVAGLLASAYSELVQRDQVRPCRVHPGAAADGARPGVGRQRVGRVSGVHRRGRHVRRHAERVWSYRAQGSGGHAGGAGGRRGRQGRRE